MGAYETGGDNLFDELGDVWGAIQDVGGFLDNFATPECGIFAVGAVGLMMPGAGGIVFAATSAIVIQAAFGQPVAAPFEVGSAMAPSVGRGYTRKFLQTHGMWGVPSRGPVLAGLKPGQILPEAAKSRAVVGGAIGYGLLIPSGIECYRSAQ